MRTPKALRKRYGHSRAGGKGGVGFLGYAGAFAVLAGAAAAGADPGIGVPVIVSGAGALLLDQLQRHDDDGDHDASDSSK